MRQQALAALRIRDSFKRRCHGTARTCGKLSTDERSTSMLTMAQAANDFPWHPQVLCEARQTRSSIRRLAHISQFASK